MIAQYKHAMETGRWHHEWSLWFTDPARKYTPDNLIKARQSSIHHQKRSEVHYKNARKIYANIQYGSFGNGN